ncbi:hypothetical protein Q3G72_009348 [Acer saccharum]|nr:hypothetical protein Q3G72_009348 [Acer saccharum]
MKGFVWGFPSSNKFWKSSWFFVGGHWGQSVSFDLEETRVTYKVPRYFCSPERWNRATPTYTDSELVALAWAAVRPLAKRGRSYLYSESKMIKAHLFPQISAHQRRLYDVDIVCDVQARRMKSVVEASRKEALRQEAAGIAPPEDDSGESSPEDTPEEEHNEGIPKYTPQETCGAGEEAVLAGDMQNPGEPPADEAATQTDSVACSRLKGKEKVGEPSEPVAFSHGTPSPRSVVNEPNDAPRDVEAAREPLGAVAPEMPVPPESVLVPSSIGGGAELRHPDLGSEDPAVDLNTSGRQSGNERGHSPNNQGNLRGPAFDEAATVSQGIDGAGEPFGVASTKFGVDVEVEDPAADLDTRRRQFEKRKASFSLGRLASKIPRVVAYVDSSSGDEETGVNVGRRLFSTPPGDRIESRAGPLTGSFPQAQTSTAVPGAGAGAVGSGLSSQSGDPNPQSMLKAMSSGHAYIGEDHWSRFRVGSPSDRLCSFFNSASYMVAEMSKAYRTSEAQEERIKRLEAQLKESEDRRARVELACQEGARSNQVLLDQCLARQMEAEQKASFAAEEAKTLQDQLSSTQDALLQAEQNAEDAKSSYEYRIENLEHQALTVKSLSKEARLELEIQGVDRFKRSPAYDALLLREFQRGMVSAGEFFKMKNRATGRARANCSLSIKKHVDTSLESLRIQMKEWQAYCQSKGKAPYPMHLEVPTADSFSTFHACEKVGIDGENPDLGLVPGTDYSAWMDDEEEDVIVWPSDDSRLSEYVIEPDPSVGGSSSQPQHRLLDLLLFNQFFRPFIKVVLPQRYAEAHHDHTLGSLHKSPRTSPGFVCVRFH